MTSMLNILGTERFNQMKRNKTITKEQNYITRPVDKLPDTDLSEEKIKYNQAIYHQPTEPMVKWLSPKPDPMDDPMSWPSILSRRECKAPLMLGGKQSQRLDNQQHRAIKSRTLPQELRTHQE